MASTMTHVFCIMSWQSPLSSTWGCIGQFCRKSPGYCNWNPEGTITRV